MDEETQKCAIAIPQWCIDAASAVLKADPCMCDGSHAEKVEHLGARYAAIIANHHANNCEPGLSRAALLEQAENQEDLLHAALCYIRREIQGY